MITYRIAHNLNDDEQCIVVDFYKSVHYSGVINPGDIFFLAYSKTNELIGCARLCSEYKTLILRGVYVHSDFQGKGIGSHLLALIDREIGLQECYCIPYNKEYLVKFYNKINFSPVTPDCAIASMQERYAKYRDQGLDVIIMLRPSN
jgi:N-acetylglutamate synthase-like GNAT family acetyltransferase